MALGISGGLPPPLLPDNPERTHSSSSLSNSSASEPTIPNPLTDKSIEQEKPENRGKISLFVTKIWQKIFVAKGDSAAEVAKESEILAQEISDEQIIKEDRNGLVVLDEKLLNRTALKYKKKNITELKTYLNDQVHKAELSDVRVGAHLLQPMARVNRNSDLVHGQVQGTSEKSENLTNLYTTNFDHIRSGVINSADKIDDFLEAIHIMRPGGPYPVRVVVNQLNSFESRNETNFVNNEHKLLLSIKDVDPKVDVVHLNTPTSRFYDWNIFFKKSFPQPWVDHFLPGEIKSKQQNLDTLCKLATWVKDDLKDKIDFDVEALTKQTDEIEALVCALQKEQTPQEMQLLKDKIAFKRGDIKRELTDTYFKLEFLATNKTDTADKDKIQLFQALLGTQLKIRNKRFSRSQEQLIIKLLNRELGVLSVVNCKSGLDRTGQSSAVELALVQLLEEGHDKHHVIQMALNWDKLSREATLGKEEPLHLLVNELRNKTLKNLICTGLVLTFNSTGMVGLKWGKGLRGQLVPLNYLPPKIYVDDTKVSLVSYHLNGTPKSLTSTGHRLLTRLSNLRGT